MVRTDRQRGWIIYNHDESYIVMMDHTYLYIYIYMMVHRRHMAQLCAFFPLITGSAAPWSTRALPPDATNP